MTNLSSDNLGSEPLLQQGPVLIYSKDPDAHFLLGTQLGFLGYQCKETDSIPDCVHCVDAIRPAAVLMDVDYPFDGDVILLGERMRSKHTPVILISNYPLKHFQELEHKLNIKDHLLKPVSLTLLEDCLKKTLAVTKTLLRRKTRQNLYQNLEALNG